MLLKQVKHSDGYLLAVAFSPGGKRLLTGSYDRTAKVWDAEKGQQLLALQGHTDRVSSVAWSPDGKRILTGSYDSTAKVWDAENGTEVLALKGHTGLVLSVSWSPTANASSLAVMTVRRRCGMPRRAPKSSLSRGTPAG